MLCGNLVVAVLEGKDVSCVCLYDFDYPFKLMGRNVKTKDRRWGNYGRINKL